MVFEKIKIKIKKLRNEANIPTKRDGDVGWDICWSPSEDFLRNNYQPEDEDKLQYLSYLDLIKSSQGLYFGPNNVLNLETGLAFSIPDGYYLEIWGKSGLAFKHNIDKKAGLIDSSFRGELKVQLKNYGQNVYWLSPGDKIAQFVIKKEIPSEMVEEDFDENDTIRGVSGFGSTGR